MSRIVDDNFDFGSAGDIPPMVPEGTYEVGYLRAVSERQFGGEKLFLWFRITEPGAVFGTELYMVCNVRKRWTPACKFWMVWTLAAGKRPGRKDRMSCAVFKNKWFKARVRVVKEAAMKGGKVPRTLAQQYCVIDTLLEVTAGGQPA